MYVLNAPEIATTAMVHNDGLDGANIRVNRLRMPKHLDRPTIMTQISDAEVVYSEYQRWAGPLEDEIARVVILNISSLLGSDTVTGFWFSGRNAPDYDIDLEILSMTGYLGTEARLEARWGISTCSEDEDAKVHITRYKRSLTSADHAAYVSAQSQLLAELSRDIVEALRDGVSKPAKKGRAK